MPLPFLSLFLFDPGGGGGGAFPDFPEQGPVTPMDGKPLSVDLWRCLLLEGEAY